MLVRDVMTTNVVTVPSSMSISEARRIMEAHRFRRLPVVDKGKLVGMVTEHGLEKVSPSKFTSLTVWELHYLLDKTPVADVMSKKVVVATPDMTVEEGVLLAQSNRVGALPVVEDDRVVGIVTTNDFFYNIVNPLLGVGKPGTRLEVVGIRDSKALEDICQAVNKSGLTIESLYVIPKPEVKEKDIVVHLLSEDVSQIVNELKSKGYSVNVRKR